MKKNGRKAEEMCLLRGKEKKKSVSLVNACVNLRRDNFDHPFVLCFLLVDYFQVSHSRLFCQSKDRCPPPCGRSSPPGRSVVDGWRRDERTRDIPQSLLCALVSSAKPTTGIQVVRSAAPTASTRSLLMPTEQGLSTPGYHDSLLPHTSQAEMTPTPTMLRPLTFDLLPLWPLPPRRGDDPSCDNCFR